MFTSALLCPLSPHLSSTLLALFPLHTHYIGSFRNPSWMSYSKFSPLCSVSYLIPLPYTYRITHSALIPYTTLIPDTPCPFLISRALPNLTMVTPLSCPTSTRFPACLSLPSPSALLPYHLLYSYLLACLLTCFQSTLLLGLPI